MPIRRHLLRWQYSAYAANHQDRLNLLIHLFSVPLFWFGALLFISPLWGQGLWWSGSGFLLSLAAFAAQGIGHRREAAAPVSFDGGLDFISRILAEQFVSFPRYALHLLRKGL